ncbi:MAG: hypothetical protein A2509_12035 [Candidatus Edwardsbacteria bacterium RIFOXYD12_FULL_50_11]|uniref:Uncharacterized protein n=1 Tax=Candidatus Edwardsbacteria bacterium GWF2_54_11 TaxID=1817851 RepID=A0A1F5REG0_9BACT|nr:MAG: hypothetical protein A2502_04025 [Candidatus Edwardsbacteria bacterium RifOxyC12_full_54_24]OGF11369.1 MAG: hypothetical protein A3K15_03345 [Candidatus Edwardsbacteria bacterium GWE2_54_12]OGF12782.1 MAG: hypothetical protein A2024_12125 [Candidatus Edwardsbacteria bacterium GWF2_54_11]OGF16847.1 MAG: hypothetical protein A2509_12035 [Candidatus Edwardsbacteria bacterium RIFOXYD12_FULL_50_11]OGJ18024.1 MAG: hypothetical protein A2349_04860 [Candidatus Edwardsbacteria bacterium RifOxyB1
MHPHHYRHIIKIAINAISIILVFACTISFSRNVNKISYGNYIALYLIVFMASWLCFFSSRLTPTGINYIYDYNASVPALLLLLGSWATIYIGFRGFEIIRVQQRTEYKVLGYLLSAFFLAVSAAIAWLFGPIIFTVDWFRWL